jgi:AcrR family transcriptional regulator/DNA-binding MarR family transcriptional regulator
MPGKRAGITAIQRARLLTAAAMAARQQGAAGVSVAEIVWRSGVSRRTFYECFADRERCLEAVLDEAIARARAHVLPVFEEQQEWHAAMRAGVAGLLAFFEEEPVLGGYLLIDSTGAGDWALARRAEVLSVVVDAIDAGRLRARSASKTLSRVTAEGVVGAVLSILQTRMLERLAGVEADGQRTESGPALGSLLGQLMAIVTLPYLGPAVAAKELARPLPTVEADDWGLADDALRGLKIRLTYRTVLVLRAVAARAGASNREIAILAGVSDQGQISKLLSRLARAGLAENVGGSYERGEANAWRLTPKGGELERAIRDGVQARATAQGGSAATRRAHG